MSRSLKKNPVLVTKRKGHKVCKRLSNKRVRKYIGMVYRGNWYKSMLNRCEIIDQRSYMSDLMYSNYCKRKEGMSWYMDKNYYEKLYRRK